MTPADRGVYALAVLWPMLVSIPLTLGLRNAVVYWDAHQEVELRNLPGTAVAGAVVSSSLLILSGLIWVGWLNPLTGLPTWIVLGAFPAILSGGVWTGLFQSRDLRVWNQLRVLNPVLYLIAVAISALMFSMSPAIAAASFLASHVVFSIYTYLRARRLGWTGNSGRSLETAKRLYAYGSRSSVSTLSEVANTRLDWAILGVLVAESDLGTYVVAANLTFLLTPILSFLAPSIVPEVAGRRGRDTNRFILRSLVATLCLGLIAVVAMWLLAPVVPMLLGDEWDETVPLIRVLAPAALLLALRAILSQVAHARGRPAIASFGDLTAAALNVVLLIVFAPTYGVVGAAWISVFTYAVNICLIAAALRFVHYPDAER